MKSKTKKTMFTINSIKLMLVLFAIILKVGSVSAAAPAPLPIQNFTNDPRVFEPRKSFWFEGNFNGTIKKDSAGNTRWQYQVDYQYRRFADAGFIKGGNYYDIFKNMYQFVLRPWIHYYAIPGKLRFSASPIGYWGTWTPPAEGTVIFNHEIRSSWQMTHYYSMGRFDFQQRYRFEFRWIGNNQIAKNQGMNQFGDVFSSEDGVYNSNSNKYRFRYLYRMTYNLTKDKSKYITAWDEVFIAMGKKTANTKILDQNRLLVLYGQKINQKRYPMEVQVGLMWQIVPKYSYNLPPTQPTSYGSLNKDNWESNLALQVYWIFNEFHRFRGLQHNKADDAAKAEEPKKM